MLSEQLGNGGFVMDQTTRTALRTIVGALETSGVLNDQSVASVIDQLRRAADVEADCDRQDEADEIRELADDIEADSRLD
jgi:regulator of protease activity HflC (stomatin/prohibitin superfamily)